MIIVLVALAASALLGLATGLMFRVWANAIVAPLVAFGSANALASHGFGFSEGVLVTVACLFISQLGYLVGAFLVSRASIANFLAEDVCDDDPDDNPRVIGQFPCAFKPYGGLPLAPEPV